jgi:hypothetical protein
MYLKDTYIITIDTREFHCHTFLYVPGAGVCECLFGPNDRFVSDRNAALAVTLFDLVIFFNPDEILTTMEYKCRHRMILPVDRQHRSINEHCIDSVPV